jgi:hypothetical protein
VPIQVILGQIQDRRGIGSEALGQRELEAGQLQHPDLGQALGVRDLAALDQPGSQHIQRCRRNVAGNRHSQAGMRAKVADQPRGGGLAVGAGDGCQAGRIPLLAQHRQRLREELDLAGDRQAAGERRGMKVRAFADFDRQARTPGHHVGVVQQRFVQGTADEAGGRHVVLQSGQLRRQVSGIGDGHPCAAKRRPTGHRQARLAQSDDQHMTSGQIEELQLFGHRVHRSFSDDRPNSTSIIVTIQKRTTT